VQLTSTNSSIGLIYALKKIFILTFYNLKIIKIKMSKLFKDKFVSHLIGYQSYIAYNLLSLNYIKRLKKPFFITLKTNSSKKLSKKTIDFFKSENLKVKLASTMVTYERKFVENKKVYIDCRKAKKKDIPQLKKICLEDSSNSRFFNDISLPLKFRKTYRAEWILNFFKKKRGDILIIAFKKKKIIGFISMLKKSFGLQIDLIASSKKFQNKKVGTSLINYINNNYLKKDNIIKAGTQLDNFKANKIYRKLGFIKKKPKFHVYHFHSNL
jgi:ribosomal protein S18 acetylase RimI-like enzyme